MFLSPEDLAGGREPCLLSSFNKGSAPQLGDITKEGLPSCIGDVLFAQRYQG